MSHQPYETWILQNETLTTTQAAELDQHLVSCSTCRQLKHNWHSVERQLRDIPFVSAPANFAARFQSSLEMRKAQERRRQVRNALWFLGGSCILISLFLLVRTVVVVTPARLIGEIIHFIVEAPQRWLELRFILYYWGSQIPPAILIISILTILGWTLILVITWLLTYLRISNQGATK